MKLLIPFTPHIAHECLELPLNKNVDNWPLIKKDILEDVKFAVQINGKTRDIITVKKNSKENEINPLILKNPKQKNLLT